MLLLFEKYFWSISATMRKIYGSAVLCLCLPVLFLFKSCSGWGSGVFAVGSGSWSFQETQGAWYDPLVCATMLQKLIHYGALWSIWEVDTFSEGWRSQRFMKWEVGTEQTRAEWRGRQRDEASEWSGILKEEENRTEGGWERKTGKGWDWGGWNRRKRSAGKAEM